MAGGLLVVLGLDRRPGEPLVGHWCGTGMHGGAIYIRGAVEPGRLGREVGLAPLQAADQQLLQRLVTEWTGYFGGDAGRILAAPFVKLVPQSLRPYGRLYAY